MRTVAIYPGRFHVFHKGHKAVYDHLAQLPGVDTVYIATSDKQEPGTSPFTFADKVTMMTKMGIPASHILQVKNPYKIDEMIRLLGLQPDQDHLIYGLGQKDAGRFKYTKDSPLQLLSQTKKLKPVAKHAYVAEVPTVPFNVLGQKITDASAVRKMYVNGNDSERFQIITDLYGSPDPELKAIFDERLGVNTPEDVVQYGTPIIDGGVREPSIRESRRARLEAVKQRITELQNKILENRRIKRQQQLDQLFEEYHNISNTNDYIDEKISR